MSIMDSMDDALLGADDDELDYDLEKDEEDALLADDNYEEDTYDIQGDNQDEPSQIEEDILDIDSNVRLDETEEDFGEQISKENTDDNLKNEPDEEDEIEEQKERNRFMNERIISQRTNSNDIPDTLEKVAVQPIPHNNHRNQKFQRGRGRGRGRQMNHNRGSVFGRVGNPPAEGKTVLINPHFRGNVQVSENARLVWDPNFQNNFQQQQRYPGPQMAQVAPFQNHPSPWATPYNEPNFNQQPNFQEPPPPVHYNQEMMNPGIRPLMQVNTQPPPFIAQQPPPQQPMTNWSDDQNYCDMFSQGNFRGQNPRYMNQQGVSPLMVNNPAPPNFNQQNNFPRNNFNFPDNQNMNQNRPFLNQNHPNAPPHINVPQNYPPQQNFDQPPPPFQQNHFNQNRPPVYDQYDHNQFQPQFSAMPNNQNFQGGNYQPPANYEPNFIPNPPPQESFPPKQYNHQYNQNRQNNHQRHPNQYNRSPGKRRSFENNPNSDHKKKKRSMEFSNLHEVPTVEMPDTTTEEKEEEDEETKKYRMKIEEQKKLREKILREKEERRKAAAAQQADSENKPTGNLITALKTITKPLIQPPPAPQQQQIQQVQPNQQNRPQNVQQKALQQQRQRQVMQRKIQNTQQQNIQVQTNPGRVQQQRRIQQPNQNIVVTQKPTPQPQRIVVMNQQQKAALPRRVVLKGMNTVSEPSSVEKATGGVENLGSFLSNRKVISSSSEATSVGLNPTMVDTPVVVVSNLAAGTTDIKIRKMCQGLGPIQNKNRWLRRRKPRQKDTSSFLMEYIS